MVTPYGYTGHLLHKNCVSNRVECFTEINRKHTDEWLRGQHGGRRLIAYLIGNISAKNIKMRSRVATITLPRRESR